MAGVLEGLMKAQRPTFSKDLEAKYSLFQEISAFLVDRQARSLSQRSIQFYREELTRFAKFAEKDNLKAVEQVEARTIRDFLNRLKETRNKGGVHAAYRTLKVFFNWWELETDPVGWHNPMDKIKIERPSEDPRPGIPIHQVLAMMDTCEKDFFGIRDRAILITLTDTGVRRNEMTSLNVEDIDLNTGELHIRHGKGDKVRVTYAGTKAKREIVRYMRLRPNAKSEDPLWIAQNGQRLTNAGLRSIVQKRAKLIGIPEPGLHDFRRCFAIECLRNGVDVYSLMRMMGHTSPQVLQRYLDIATEDIKCAHDKGSPMDNA
jgi:site-specific recombinase XerD